MAAAIILARGGSKGIPMKNLAPLNGKPLISYSLGIGQFLFEKIYVSTDSERIAKYAKTFPKVEMIMRPDELALDTSPSEDALLHACENIRNKIIVFIQPTSPLLRIEHLQDGLTKIENCDSVFSVYKEHWLPQWSLDLTPIEWTTINRPRRQDREETYVENGAFYIFRREDFLREKVRMFGRKDVVLMSKQDSMQIDSKEDMEEVSKLLFMRDKMQYYCSWCEQLSCVCE